MLRGGVGDGPNLAAEVVGSGLICSLAPRDAADSVGAGKSMSAVSVPGRRIGRFGRCWPLLARTRPTMGEIGGAAGVRPELDQLSAKFASSGARSTNFKRSEPMLPMLSRTCPNFYAHCQCWTDFMQLYATLARRPLGRHWPILARLRPIFGSQGPLLARIRRCLGEFGQFRDDLGLRARSIFPRRLDSIVQLILGILPRRPSEDHVR